VEKELRIANAIRPFVPNGTSDSLARQIVQHRCHLTITRDRRTKSGDYRHPVNGHGHRISVNGSLNEYAFLITFLHEMAHLVNWERYGNKVSPHGKEWKQAFKETMQPYLNDTVFPAEILKVLEHHMKDPKSATVRDLQLVRVLKKYDAPSQTVHLEDLPEGAEFLLSGRRFVKGEKLRKRFRCKEASSGRLYLVSAIAEVQHA
jgi:hypothetical protein